MTLSLLSNWIKLAFLFRIQNKTLSNSFDDFIFVVSAFTSPNRLSTGELVDHKATDHDTIHSFKTQIV